MVIFAHSLLKIARKINLISENYRDDCIGIKHTGLLIYIHNERQYYNQSSSVTKQTRVKKMSSVILIVCLLAGMISTLGRADSSYGNELISNNITNSTTAGINNTDGNSTASNTQTGSVPNDDKTGIIASIPGKCLGSALCPD